MHPKRITVKITVKLPIKPFVPEPLNNPYQIIKKTGNIRKHHGCGNIKKVGNIRKHHGCSKDLDEYAVGRWEVDFFSKVEKEVKYQGPKTDAEIEDPVLL